MFRFEAFAAFAAFRDAYLRPALNAGFIEMTIPDKPKSCLQRYRLTALGKRLTGNFS